MKTSKNRIKNKYDIISVSHFFYPRVGGLESMAYNLLTDLTKKGLNCIALFGADKRISTSINGFDTESFKTKRLFNGTYPIFFPGFVIFLYNLLRSNPNSKVLIHSRHLISSVIASILCKILGISYIVVEHNSGRAYFGSRFVTELAQMADKYIFSNVYKNADSVIAVSKAGKKWLTNFFKVSRNKVSVINNGFNKLEIKQDKNEKENIVIWAAKWIKVKDPNTALRAFKRVANLHPDWKFIFIGEGKEHLQIRGLPQNLEVYPEFLKQEDLLRLLKKSKVYVNSSLSEGLSLGILEAISLGNLPVLSDAPSNKEVAKKLGFGDYIFMRGNITDLSRKLSKAINDHDSKRKGLDKSSDVDKKYSNSEMASKYFKHIFPFRAQQGNVKTLSVVVPVYNEGRYISKILSNLSNLVLIEGIKKEIIIVNDCSTDRSKEKIKQFIGKNRKKVSFKYLENRENLGKSQTVKKGILAAKGGLIVVQDADLEYSVKDLARFVELFVDNPTLDLIYGNRFNGGNQFINYQHFFGNKALTGFSNLLTSRYNFRVSDMETCYKMARKEVYEAIISEVESRTNFGIEPELTSLFAKYINKDGNNINYIEKDIYYNPRTKEEGKKIRWFKNGFEALGEILKYNLVTGNGIRLFRTNLDLSQTK